MKYESFRPAAELAPFIKCYWSVTGDARGGPEIDTVVPDGCAEMVFNAGERMMQYDGANLKAQPRATLVAEVRRPVILHNAGIIDIFGVRLTPVGIRSLLRIPAHEVIDRATDLEDLADPHLRDGILRMLQAPNHARPDLADAVFCDIVRRRRVLDPLVWRAAVTMERTDGRCSIADMANRAGMTPRQLERRFREQVGIPPSALASVLRFRRVLASLDDQMPGWAHVAAVCGYHDQSHLIRDFKRYAGMSPRAYLGEAHPFGDLFRPST